MAQRTIVTMTDDLDGSVATETVSFGLDGAGFEIDLTAAHAEELREVLGQFVAHARTAGGTGGPRRRRQAARPAASAHGELDSKAVRTWAAEQGIAVSARGRLKADVLEQYLAATA